MSCHDNNIQFGGACVHHPYPVEVRLNPTSTPLLHLDGIGMRRDDRIILHGIDLTVHRGDFVAITGPNGGGKTTLLRIILGLLSPTSGRVIFDGERPAIGYLPQKNAIDSQFPLTVSDVILSGLLGIRGMSAAERESRLRSTIARIEMEDLADRPIGRLSGGQLQRTLLGRAIIADPQLLVLDEPLSYIDKHFEAHIYRMLAEIAPHCTILLVSHEMTEISSMANRHLIVDRTVTECNARHHYRPSECDHEAASLI